MRCFVSPVLTLATFFALTTGCVTPEPQAVIIDIKGRVQDQALQHPIAGADVVFYTSIGEYLGEATTSSIGDYRLNLTLPYSSEGTSLRVYASAEGFTDVLLYEDFFLSDPKSAALTLAPAHTITPTRINPQMIGMVSNGAGNGSVSGRIFNAMDADQITGVGGLEISLREGINAPADEPVVASGITAGTGAGDSPVNGFYSIDGLAPGTYTASFPASDAWHDAFFTVYVHPGVLTVNQNAGTSPPPAENEARIIMFWDNGPANLDLHLTGPIPGQGLEGEVLGVERLHIFSGEPLYPKDSSEESADVVMNIDDTEYNGPETITIQRIESEGVYRVSVHDASNPGSTDSAALSFSKARVQVIVGDSIRRFYEIKGDDISTVWRVMEFNGETLEVYPLNNYDWASSSGDADLF